MTSIFSHFVVGCVAVLALAIPSVASAEGSTGEPNNAAKLCQALRTQMGVDAFRGQYSSNDNKRNAFGKCLAEQRRKRGLVQAALGECKAEYTADPTAFLAKYGVKPEPSTAEEHPPTAPTGEEHPPTAPTPAEPTSPDNGLRAAMAHCVREQVGKLVASVKSAAHACKEELTADPVAFRDKYGSNHNKRNAFGKCVSQHVKNGNDDLSDAPETPAAPESPESPDSPSGSEPGRV